ncbi:hypothetical protein [Chromobacterium sp. IRSSSOUMB001]|uniref:hypothetical protein n=1 Tax=Chromobacterium sp. IRSSSOUMB001 TaxID=2927123 RepID=UPI0020BF719C|nr:hypothetical protein [Chromobacterium sp. IRSSSOUMB001]
MENLLGAPSSSHYCIDMTINTIVSTEFPQITVWRKLGSYGGMLGLQPKCAKVPNPEFIVRLLTGHVSHQALFRREVGGHFKNLENLIRGKHKTSQTTKQLLISQLRLSTGEVDGLAGSSLDGPLMPRILNMFHLVENLPRQVITRALDIEIPCAHCGKNMLASTDEWWSEHAPGMGGAEYLFAERLLRASLGASLFEQMAAHFLNGVVPSLENLEALASPKRHPIGNWLWEAMEAMSCTSLAELAATMNLRGGVGATFSHARLRKWSAGQDVMPLDAGQEIAEACGNTASRVRRLIAARVIALVVDFVEASLVADGGRNVARELVYARLVKLNKNLQIAIRTISKES